jgi:hypothetical protein
MKPETRRNPRLVRNVLVVAAVAAALGSGLTLAAKPGGGGTTTWNVRLHGIGDSIMRGYNASCTGNTSVLDLFCYSGGDQPTNSFFDGTSTAVKSLADWFIAAGAKTTYSKVASQSGTEMVGGSNNFEAQAATVAANARVLGLPVQVKVELGGNDICKRTTVAQLYDDATWRTAVRNGLGVLTTGLPQGSSVVLVGVPRVQDLYVVGVAKGSSRVNCPSFWETYDVCEIATVDRPIDGMSLADRRTAIGLRQQAYNSILLNEARNFSGLNGVEVVAETDGAYTNSTPEVGNYSFTTTEINGGDCFHPSIAGQNKVATVVWGNDPYRTKPR